MTCLSRSCFKGCNIADDIMVFCLFCILICLFLFLSDYGLCLAVACCLYLGYNSPDDLVTQQHFTKNRNVDDSQISKFTQTIFWS